MDWIRLAEVGIRRFSSCEHGNEGGVYNKRLTIFQPYSQTVSSIAQTMLHVPVSP